MGAHYEIAPMPVAALHELKDWLRIDRGEEDALLAGLIRAALDAAHAFTGQRMLAGYVDEQVPPHDGWMRLSAMPVLSIEGATMLFAEGADQPLASGKWEPDIGRDGDGWVRILHGGAARAIRIRYRAGIAESWHSLPEPLRQGVIRYAAHVHALRDGGEARTPASIAALWQPWRRIRL